MSHRPWYQVLSCAVYYNKEIEGRSILITKDLGMHTMASLNFEMDVYSAAELHQTWLSAGGAALGGQAAEQATYMRLKRA